MEKASLSVTELWWLGRAEWLKSKQQQKKQEPKEAKLMWRKCWASGSECSWHCNDITINVAYSSLHKSLGGGI